MERKWGKIWGLIGFLLLNFVNNVLSLSITITKAECVYEIVRSEGDIVSGNFVVVDHHIFWSSDHPGIDFSVTFVIPISLCFCPLFRKIHVDLIFKIFVIDFNGLLLVLNTGFYCFSLYIYCWIILYEFENSKLKFSREIMMIFAINFNGFLVSVEYEILLLQFMHLPLNYIIWIRKFIFGFEFFLR